MTETQRSVLDAANAVTHLRERGLVGDAEPVEVSELTGGVSGVVLAARTDRRRLILKQSLAQLRTERVWLSDPRRILIEARALELCHGLTPERTPAVHDVDPDSLVLVMAGAPPDWRDWKSLLLADPAPAEEEILAVATALGATLGTWHQATAGLLDAADARLDVFADRGVFTELRVDPFHRAVSRAHPDLAPAVDACADELLAGAECLVHGDFSPKNVLVGDAGTWVVDFEVAHLGRAVFDLAFVTSHLALKAIHRKALAGALHRGWSELVAAYSARTRRALPDRMAWHVASLMLARVDGVSPATYLTATDRARVRTLCRAVLRATDVDMSTLWCSVMDERR